MGEIKAGKVAGSPVRSNSVCEAGEGSICEAKNKELVEQEEVKKGSKGW